MVSTTSIGRGPAHGSNENHDGDPTHTTLGEGVSNDDAPNGSEDLLHAAPEHPPAAQPPQSQAGAPPAGRPRMHGGPGGRKSRPQ